MLDASTSNDIINTSNIQRFKPKSKHLKMPTIQTFKPRDVSVKHSNIQSLRSHTFHALTPHSLKSLVRVHTTSHTLRSLSLSLSLYLSLSLSLFLCLCGYVYIYIYNLQIRLLNLCVTKFICQETNTCATLVHPRNAQVVHMQLGLLIFMLLSLCYYILLGEG